jgi:hypothetical protein
MRAKGNIFFSYHQHWGHLLRSLQVFTGFRFCAPPNDVQNWSHNCYNYLYIKDAKSYFDEPREKLSPRPLCGRSNLVIVKGFRSQGVDNILCATQKFVSIGRSNEILG